MHYNNKCMTWSLQFLGKCLEAFGIMSPKISKKVNEQFTIVQKCTTVNQKWYKKTLFKLSISLGAKSSNARLKCVFHLDYFFLYLWIEVCINT